MRGILMIETFTIGGCNVLNTVYPRSNVWLSGNRTEGGSNNDPNSALCGKLTRAVIST